MFNVLQGWAHQLLGNKQSLLYWLTLNFFQTFTFHLPHVLLLVSLSYGKVHNIRRANNISCLIVENNCHESEMLRTNVFETVRLVLNYSLFKRPWSTLSKYGAIHIFVIIIIIVIIIWAWKSCWCHESIQDADIKPLINILSTGAHFQFCRLCVGV